MKKRLITLLMAAALLTTMTITALADDGVLFELPTDGDSIEQGGAMPQWCTDGTDDTEFDLTWETLQASTGIVFEMPEDPEWWVTIIFGAWQGWSWGDGQIDDVRYHFAGGKLIVWWEHNDVDFSGLSEEDSTVKMLFGQWGVDWSEHGVTKVYLTDLEPIELREEEVPTADEPVVDEPAVPDEPAPEPEQPTAEPVPIIADLEDDLKKDEGGLPVWTWILIGGGAAICITTGVIVAVKSKK